MGDLEKLKEVFQEEFKTIDSLDELKDVFATELARRDKIIADLQEQNKLLLQSVFREKKNLLEKNT